MNQEIIICENCKKETDLITLTALVGDEKLISPIERITPLKCSRCGRELVSNEKFFKITE